MTFLHIIVVSIVQGLTEFLPISSSGHLVVVPSLVNLPDQGIIMDLAVHVGTLLAVLVYYRRDIWEISWACLQWKTTKNKTARNLGFYIVLGTIPAVLVGLLMHKFIPEGIRDVRVITATLIFFGVVMGVVDYYRPRGQHLSELTLKSALFIGFAQVLALIPGTSRSGITITAGRFLGFNRVDAARFSFLLSIPATAGAGFLGFLDVIALKDVQLGMDMGIAIFMTFLTGLFAISFMMRWLKNYGLMPFVVYRVLLGFGLLFFLVF